MTCSRGTACPQLREFYFTESTFERRAPSAVPAAVFEPEPELLSEAKPNTRPPTPDTRTAAPLAVTPLPLAASAELEVEALRLLNQAGADLGEQITVNRQSDGLLHISGIVETDKRKAEVLAALSSISSNPSLRIEIQTVAEAVAAQRQTRPTPLPKQQQVQIAGNTMAAEPQLRAYFTGRVKDTDEAIRQYAARTVSLSNRGMDHLWAMKRLFNQFSPEEVRALTPEARAKWTGLIRSHARSYQQANESLRRELHPVFFAGQSFGLSSEGIAITDTNELDRVVNELFELGSSNDRIIRSAFTSSSGGVMTTVVTTPQFWQSLKNAEVLAARIAARSEERRVGKECRSRWSPYH